ncbi:MAG: SemiSWEET family sugar transporter [bacterium]|nr:SemiSWEET family sugar transporter [bacterium]
MDTPAIETIGLLAGTLTTVSFTPQLLRIWKRRSAADISYTALLSFIVGISLWLWYGILIHSLSVILANGVSIVLNLSILALKIAHHERCES